MKSHLFDLAMVGAALLFVVAKERNSQGATTGNSTGISTSDHLRDTPITINDGGMGHLGATLAQPPRVWSWEPAAGSVARGQWLKRALVRRGSGWTAPSGFQWIATDGQPYPGADGGVMPVLFANRMFNIDGRGHTLLPPQWTASRQVLP